MSPTPSDSGPVDGQEVKIDVVPHHAAHKVEQRSKGGIVKIALTGAAVIGGIVGLYFLWRHFFGKKKNAPNANGNNGQKFKKRELTEDEMNDEIQAAYYEAMRDEEFLEFLNDQGLLDELEG
jgi:hypothetical protein